MKGLGIYKSVNNQQGSEDAEKKSGRHCQQPLTPLKALGLSGAALIQPVS